MWHLYLPVNCRICTESATLCRIRWNLHNDSALKTTMWNQNENKSETISKLNVSLLLNDNQNTPHLFWVMLTDSRCGMHYRYNKKLEQATGAAVKWMNASLFATVCLSRTSSKSHFVRCTRINLDIIKSLWVSAQQYRRSQDAHYVCTQKNDESLENVSFMWERWNKCFMKFKYLYRNMLLNLISVIAFSNKLKRSLQFPRSFRFFTSGRGIPAAVY